MTNKFTSPGSGKEVLRVALDKQAVQDLAQMAERLKAENPHVRVQPSAFVSFLVSDFYTTYFERDLEVLVAEFFDSKSYHDGMLQSAGSACDFEKVMSASLTEIKRIKAKTRSSGVKRGKPKQSSSSVNGE